MQLSIIKKKITKYFTDLAGYVLTVQYIQHLFGPKYNVKGPISCQTTSQSHSSPVSQTLVSMSNPSQSSPPPEGGGSVHDLVLVLRPHSGAGHGLQADQIVQLPLTGMARKRGLFFFGSMKMFAK